MNDFQTVNRASLYYRLFPRTFVSLFIATIIAVILSLVLGYLGITNSLSLSLMAGLALFILLVLVTYTIAYLEYTNLKYLIEEHSIFLKEGVLRVDTETIPFQKIRNASYYQSFLQRIFSVGDIVIDQDPESYTWVSIDSKTARTILDSVSERSNIQPISVEPNQPNPYQKAPQS